MSLKTKYIIFIVLIHVVFTILLFQLFREKLYYFVLSETLIFLSLLISYRLYQALIYPISLMKTGVNAILDEDFNTKFLETGSSEIDQLIRVFNQMLERLRTERLRTEEQAYFLENLINSSPVGMIILDYDGNISSMNTQAINYLVNSRESLPKSFSDIDHPLAEYISALKLGQSEVFTLNGIQQFKCQSEQIFHKGFYRKFVIIEELSSELLKSEKLAYGKVIRMMAHEVNNSMGAINSILQTVIDFGFDDGDENADLKESLIVAKDRNDSLANFVKNFANVIRLPIPSKKLRNIGDLVGRCLGIYHSQFKERNITVDLFGMDNEVVINLDPVQIEQVLLNVFKNAIESIGSEGHISIYISADRPHIVIADNGPGIDLENREMIFSPFFSTKPTGQGIGLILTREILTNHNAEFSLYTDPKDQLTRFTIGF